MRQDIDPGAEGTSFPDANRPRFAAGSAAAAGEPRSDAIDIEAIARNNLRLEHQRRARIADYAARNLHHAGDAPAEPAALDRSGRFDPGAVLVLRGLKAQSMRQTIAVVGELIGERKGGLGHRSRGVHAFPVCVRRRPSSSR